MDIIVCFDEKKMGYGDILFATKLAGLLRQSLINQGKLIGSVYLVCSEDNRGLSKLQSARADCEFGINFVLVKDMDALIAEGKVVPSIIIDAPAPMPSKIKFNTPQTLVIVSLEYTYGPYQAVRLGTSYTHAEHEKKEAYQLALTKYEHTMLGQYSTQNKKVFRTGLLEALDEHGIILTKELCELGNLLHSSHPPADKSIKLDQLKQKFFNHLSTKTKKALVGAAVQARFAQYEEETNLTFGYGYSGVKDFIHIHQACRRAGVKNEDVFIVSDNLNVKDWLQKTVVSLKDNGFAKVIYMDLRTGKEIVLYDNGQKGKTYRLLHSFNLTHPEVVALYAISGPLALATGDQSFMEAIQTNKIVCYDCFPHKELLYSAYQDMGDGFSEETQHVLRALRLTKSSPERLTTANLSKLPALVNLPQVKAELSQINELIRNSKSLVDFYLQEIDLVLPKIDNLLDLAIINDTFDDKMLEEVQYPHHLFLAITYGHEQIVLKLLTNQPNCLTSQDKLGNNAFIIAAQHQQYGVLALLIKHAFQQRISFAQIIHPNNHFLRYNVFDYLPEFIKEDKVMLTQLFSSYMNEVQQMIGNIESASAAKQESELVQLSFYKIKEKSFWESIEEQILNKLIVDLDDDTLRARIVPFLVVMRDYFKRSENEKEDLALVNRLCDELAIPEDWEIQHEKKFLTDREMVFSLIKENAILAKYYREETIQETKPKGLFL